MDLLWRGARRAGGGHRLSVRLVGRAHQPGAEIDGISGGILPPNFERSRLDTGDYLADVMTSAGMYCQTEMLVFLLVREGGGQKKMLGISA